ncbi:MAG: GNAT family N-acetyltransferase [Clostridia bacterium]
MHFRSATPDDIDKIMRIITQGQEFIRSQGFIQWTNGYPEKELLMQDIAHGNAHVLMQDGEMLSVAVVIIGDEPNYRHIYDGEWNSNDEYATIHRMAVSAEHRGSGVAMVMFTQITDMCVNAGIRNIRADTHENNVPMRGALERSGFICRGSVYMVDGQKRVAYEKHID